MNGDRGEGNWRQFMRKVWGALTVDDLDRIGGRPEELTGLIQTRYGRSQDEAARVVEAWLARN